MLRDIRDDLKKHYYDPAFHGMDIDARFKAADEKLNQADSVGQLWGIIAQALTDLHDSHTFFIPPATRARVDYGWQMQAIGDRCLVTAVKPGSDAAAQGLKAGDEIVAIDNLAPIRENLWLIGYLYYSLRPQPAVRLTITTPSGEERRIDVRSQVTYRKQVADLTGEDIWDVIRDAESEDRLHRHRYVESGDVFIWKMPQFDLSVEEVDGMIDKAKRRKNLLLDLRGNGGGSQETLLRLTGSLFDRDVRIGDLKDRKTTKPLVAKSRGSGGFTGKLVVLIDSQSASAAELLARVVQLEKRGAVVGDRTAGAVMQSTHYDHQVGLDTVVFYGVSITTADILMTDGRSLEGQGVAADHVRRPSAADLSAHRDPVMAYGASLLGIELSPEQAGAFFPIEWRK